MSLSRAKGRKLINNSSASALFRLTLSLIIFGTIGIFVRHILLPSSMIVFVRGVTGMTFFLLLAIRLTAAGAVMILGSAGQRAAG